MKFTRTCIALAAIVACRGFLAQATPQAEQSQIDSADRLFQAGKFPEAEKLYSRIAAQNPKDHSATVQLGRIALLCNRLEGAQKWLEKALVLQPDDTDAKVMLAQVFCRRDDFQKAAASLSGVDVSSNKLIISQYPTMNVAKLESFKGQTPYELQGDGTTTRLKFLKTDPLPLVNLHINGGDEVTFFIDTGVSEVALQEDKASEGAGGGGKLKIVPDTVRHLSFGGIKEDNVPGLYDGPFPWEYTFGFHLAGMVGHDFFKPYAVTFDFKNMQIFLQ
jgi:tetratricopeptide (TPR) repeat protein